IQNDPNVGCPPLWVPGYMQELSQTIRAGLGTLDAANQLPDGQVPAEQKVAYVVAFACRVFEMFLRIHPYVNGNGHAERFISWAIVGRYGYWPMKWSVEPRPPDPPYTNLITAYRAGNPQALEEFVLRCIVAA